MDMRYLVVIILSLLITSIVVANGYKQKENKMSKQKKATQRIRGPENWKWSGYLAHQFADKADGVYRFHLTTRVNKDFSVSTIGSYSPTGGEMSTLPIKGAYFFHTTVSMRVNLKDGGCCFETAEEKFYETVDEATLGHMEMCYKYTDKYSTNTCPGCGFDPIAHGMIMED